MWLPSVPDHESQGLIDDVHQSPNYGEFVSAAVAQAAPEQLGAT